MLPIGEKYRKFFDKLSRLTHPSNIINHFIKTHDNVTLDVVQIKNPDSDKYIIFSHGNAGNLSMRFDIIKFLYNYASIIIFDYRCYGRSSNTSNLSSEGLLIDTESVWNFVTTNLKINPNKVCLFGESLGCSIIIGLSAKLSKLSHEFYPHSIVLNSPFYSLSDMIQNMFDKINIGLVGRIVNLILNKEYESNEWIQFINHRTKIIIAHSINDEIIPYSQGRRLYKSIAHIHPKIKFIDIDGTHNNLGLTDKYIYELSELFDD